MSDNELERTARDVHAAVLNAHLPGGKTKLVSKLLYSKMELNMVETGARHGPQGELERTARDMHGAVLYAHLMRMNKTFLNSSITKLTLSKHGNS